MGSTEDRLARFAGAPLSYPEVGRTAGDSPPGYRAIRLGRVVGRGPDVFAVAAERLLSWRLHRRAGLQVLAEGPRVVLDQTALLRIRLGPLPIEAPVRVVTLIEEADEVGFAYGTLVGHPETGEERFSVRRLPDDTVLAEIRAFSRPARWYARLGGPLTRAVQDRATRRYLAAMG